MLVSYLPSGESGTGQTRRATAATAAAGISLLTLSCLGRYLSRAAKQVSLRYPRYVGEIHIMLYQNTWFNIVTKHEFPHTTL